MSSGMEPVRRHELVQLYGRIKKLEDQVADLTTPRTCDTCGATDNRYDEHPCKTCKIGHQRPGDTDNWTRRKTNDG